MARKLGARLGSWISPSLIAQCNIEQEEPKICSGASCLFCGRTEKVLRMSAFVGALHYY